LGGGLSQLDGRAELALRLGREQQWYRNSRAKYAINRLAASVGEGDAFADRV